MSEIKVTLYHDDAQCLPTKLRDFIGELEKILASVPVKFSDAVQINFEVEPYWTGPPNIIISYRRPQTPEEISLQELKKREGAILERHKKYLRYLELQKEFASVNAEEGKSK